MTLGSSTDGSAWRTAWRVVTWPFRAAWAGLAWLWMQATGAADRFRRFVVRDLSTQEMLPPSVHDTIVWFLNQFHRAIGWGSPGEQVVASIVLAIAAIVTSAVTAGLTLVLVAVFAITFLIGSARFIPAVDQQWPLSPPGPAVLRVGGGDVE